jgi:hypothetical protein
MKTAEQKSLAEIRAGFRVALNLGPRDAVTVRFWADETITVKADGMDWAMECSSDEDRYDFYAVDPKPEARPARPCHVREASWW